MDAPQSQLLNNKMSILITAKLAFFKQVAGFFGLYSCVPSSTEFCNILHVRYILLKPLRRGDLPVQIYHGAMGYLLALQCGKVERETARDTYMQNTCREFDSD